MWDHSQTRRLSVARNRHLEASSLTISRADDNPLRALPRDLETDAGIARLLLDDADQSGVKSSEIAEKIGDHAIDRLGTWAMTLGWIVQATAENGYSMPDCWVLTQTGRRCAAQRIDLWGRETARRKAAADANTSAGTDSEVRIVRTKRGRKAATINEQPTEGAE